MRQFVLGLLVAAFLWWGFGSGGGTTNAGEQPSAGAPSPAAEPPAASPAPGPLERVLGNGTAAPKPAGESALASPAAAADLEALLPRIALHEAPAVDTGWALLAQNQAFAARARLAAGLASGGGDFPALLGQLGSFNTCLHSAEGRALAGKALAAAMALGDAEAVAAGSALLGLLVRGRIEKGDTEARAFVDEAYRQHRVRVDRWLCSTANVARARTCTVQKGDSLARIAGRFRREHKLLVDDGTLAVLNRIHNPNALQVGQKVKVPVDPVRAVLEKRSFALSVYVGEDLLRLYWVGHGEGDKTPVTTFTVSEKLPQPEWTAPDGIRYPYGHPKNILGEYFIKFQHDSHPGFGAHGTPMPETICTMSSMGCIRMLGPDIAELFRILPRGAEVEVRASAATP